MRKGKRNNGPFYVQSMNIIICAQVPNFKLIINSDDNV